MPRKRKRSPHAQTPADMLAMLVLLIWFFGSPIVLSSLGIDMLLTFIINLSGCAAILVGSIYGEDYYSKWKSNKIYRYLDQIPDTFPFTWDEYIKKEAIEPEIIRKIEYLRREGVLSESGLRSIKKIIMNFDDSSSITTDEDSYEYSREELIDDILKDIDDFFAHFSTDAKFKDKKFYLILYEEEGITLTSDVLPDLNYEPNLEIIAESTAKCFTTYTRAVNKFFFNMTNFDSLRKMMPGLKDKEHRIEREKLIEIYAEEMKAHRNKQQEKIIWWDLQDSLPTHYLFTDQDFARMHKKCEFKGKTDKEKTQCTHQNNIQPYCKLPFCPYEQTLIKFIYSK